MNPNDCFARIVLTDGSSFYLRLVRETDVLLMGYVVNREGEEIVPNAQSDRTLRVISKDLIKKRTNMRLDFKYSTLVKSNRS